MRGVFQQPHRHQFDEAELDASPYPRLIGG